MCLILISALICITLPEIMTGKITTYNVSSCDVSGNLRIHNTYYIVANLGGGVCQGDSLLVLSMARLYAN